MSQINSISIIVSIILYGVSSGRTNHQIQTTPGGVKMLSALWQLMTTSFASSPSFHRMLKDCVNGAHLHFTIASQFASLPMTTLVILIGQGIRDT